MFIVYKHTNQINNKVYIGQTNNPSKRWKPSSYISSPYFYAAIQKYGWENFSHETLASHLSQEEANKLEIYYINLYNATNSQYGYNLANGGAHVRNLEGENNPFFGKHHSEETLAILKEKKFGGNNPNAKPVRCITTGEVFPSCREAANWCGISRQNINRCAKGGRPSAGKHPITKEKLQWRYIEDEI